MGREDRIEALDYLFSALRRRLRSIYQRQICSRAGDHLDVYIVVQGAQGQLLHFERLGLLAISVSILSLWIFRQVKAAE